MKMVLNIPNSLTVLRIVLIPAFVIALQYGRTDVALYLFVAAALSDGLDGLIARLKHQKTALGAILDPLADKFMLITSFVFYAYFGWLPTWLTIIVISRDLMVVAGWMAVYFSTRRMVVNPSVFGKAAIFTQFVLICYILLYKNFGILPGLYRPLIMLTTALVMFSGLHYVYRELRIASGK
ncbi:MAG: CDP-alcohol phosphatidyltransferase family protein [Nitrospirota bacterium]|jgi:cardiolipin synthase